MAIGIEDPPIGTDASFVGFPGLIERLDDRIVDAATGWHTHLGVLVDQLEGRDLRPFWPSFEHWRTEYERRLPAD